MNTNKPEGIKHKYKKGDPVTVYADKVGPFSNPSEKYTYYNLPYCRPGFLLLYWFQVFLFLHAKLYHSYILLHLDYISDSLSENKPSLGEILNGDRLVVAPYKVDFLMERSCEVVCRKNMTREEVHRFRTAVEQDYYIQLCLGDLPIWAIIGKLDRGDEFKYFINTHLHFDIFYNGNYVTEVYLWNDPSAVTDITMDKVVDIEFLYTVTWKETDIAFEERMQKYTMPVHRFSITSFLVAILILIGCLGGLYVFVLQRDFYKGGIGNDEELASNHNKSGWKVLHGDVFRYPNYKSFFTAAVGCGLQSFTVITSLILLGCAGVFRPYDRESMWTALVFSYAAACGVAGFTAVSLYHQLEGTNWMENLFITECLAFGPLVVATYGTSAALPFSESATTVIYLVWVLLALPLLLLGGILGKLFTSKFEAPCRTIDFPREIPNLRWYRGLVPQMLLGGFLPFGMIYEHLFYVIASVWGHRIFTSSYGVLLIAFGLFIITIALVSVGLTYFQLAAEDYHWWWRSFLCGGSTGLYVFGYCCYYYYMARSDMNSFMEVSFFFGYMACICCSLFLMSGSVAFCASFLFVRYFYSNIKSDKKG